MKMMPASSLSMAVKDTRSGVGRGLQGITASNSNTRISATRIPNRAVSNAAAAPLALDSLGLGSERPRAAMVQRLQSQGMTNDLVLAAMQTIPRHAFVDEALASRAYDDASLPIGHGQTISQPWVVARMIASVCGDSMPARVLEVGTGCGYQAAVMAQVFQQVHSIERIRALYDMAKERLRVLRLTKVRLVHGDGMLGLPSVAPFDAIIVAAAGIRIPQALLMQLSVGGVLIAPEGTGAQRLVRVTRTGASSWDRQELEEVRFVPLKSGLQV
jgi:protein-L-isoaspartate(D-aspartate) O-methyltransferase